MKKYFIILILLSICMYFSLMFFFNTYNYDNSEPYVEPTTLYYKHVPCVVEKINVSRGGLYAQLHRAYLTIYNKEYNLKKNIELVGSDAINCQNLTNGSIVYAYMYSLVDNTTNQVLNRRLCEIDLNYKGGD